MTKDLYGNAMTGASAQAAQHYLRALKQFACYVEDPLASLASAIEDSPQFAMAHLAAAHMNLAGTDKSALEVADAAISNLSGLRLNQRELAHLEAVKAFRAGRFGDGHETLEQIVMQHPRDLLAIQTAHLWDFLRGDARRLRERIGMVLPHWSEADSDYHALLGMHAFGLEECGQYREAESQGRRAVDLNFRDAWAQHAVAHVLEMQGRIDEGIQWMVENEAGWAPDSFFAVHNWWHLALYHLDKGDVDQVLALYDGPIRRGRSEIMMDMVDASALLWRLHLRGVDVGERWAALADDWAPFAQDGYYAFNDVHAIMAFVGAGRDEDLTRTLSCMRRQTGGAGSNASMTREVGLPVATALQAYSVGAYDRTVAELLPIRSIAGRFGGSHAQRDLLDLTLIEAAIRGGNKSVAVAFTGERAHRKPASPLEGLLKRRANSVEQREAA